MELLVHTHITCESNLILYLSNILLNCVCRSHPERPDRITRIYDKHKDCGLLQRCKQLQVNTLNQFIHNFIIIKMLSCTFILEID